MKAASKEWGVTAASDVAHVPSQWGLRITVGFSTWTPCGPCHPGTESIPLRQVQRS